MIEALYVHIPFCEAKCNYCDFTSFSGCSEETKEQYVEALKREALRQKGLFPMHLKSIFFGGGTPTCLSSGLLVHLLNFLCTHFPIADNIEISTEANPGTIDREKLTLLKNGGVNRISLGIQSFNPYQLQRLGRIHTEQQAFEAYNLVREAGFANVNIDLMYGLPEQGIEDWQNTLQKVITLNPEHISLYQLKIECGTPLGDEYKSGVLGEFDDEQALKMYRAAIDTLGQKGYIHYEISNFARRGFKSRHNQMYWLTRPYLGLGAGAHSYLPPYRKENIGDLQKYTDSLLKGEAAPSFNEKISTNMAMAETMFMGLRLLDGVNIEEFSKRYNTNSFQVFSDPIKKCISNGLLEVKGNRIRLTEKGLYLGNLVFEEFLL
ncbi:MAG: radical SAM family heme chaperone HemW [Bacillota bacterium]